MWGEQPIWKRALTHTQRAQDLDMQRARRTHTYVITYTHV